MLPWTDLIALAPPSKLVQLRSALLALCGRRHRGRSTYCGDGKRGDTFPSLRWPHLEPTFKTLISHRQRSRTKEQPRNSPRTNRDLRNYRGQSQEQ